MHNHYFFYDNLIEPLVLAYIYDTKNINAHLEKLVSNNWRGREELAYTGKDSNSILFHLFLNTLSQVMSKIFSNELSFYLL